MTHGFCHKKSGFILEPKTITNGFWLTKNKRTTLKAIPISYLDSSTVGSSNSRKLQKDSINIFYDEHRIVQTEIMNRLTFSHHKPALPKIFMEVRAWNKLRRTFKYQNPELEATGPVSHFTFHLFFCLSSSHPRPQNISLKIWVEKERNIPTSRTEGTGTAGPHFIP